MKIKFDKNDTNYFEFFGFTALMEYNHKDRIWEGWIKDSGTTYLDKNPNEIYSDLYYEAKVLRDEKCTSLSGQAT